MPIIVIDHDSIRRDALLAIQRAWPLPGRDRADRLRVWADMLASCERAHLIEDALGGADVAVFVRSWLGASDEPLSIPERAV